MLVQIAFRWSRWPNAVALAFPVELVAQCWYKLFPVELVAQCWSNLFSGGASCWRYFGVRCCPGPSWQPIGSIFAPCGLLRVLPGLSWAPFWLPWWILGSSWDPLGLPFGFLGGSWDAPGALLRAMWAPFSGLWGLPWAPHRAQGGSELDFADVGDHFGATGSFEKQVRMLLSCKHTAQTLLRWTRRLKNLRLNTILKTGF